MKIPNLRWFIIALIGVATLINFIDRSALTIMWPFIYQDFNISHEDSKSTLAMITSCFLVAYALGQTAFGKIMDAIGTRFGMVISIVLWSISIALHSLAKSIVSFNIFRFMLGFSEAGNWPGATKSNAEWFPAKERAIAQGIFGAGASLGSVVSAPIIAALFLAFGWKMTFFLIAGLGFLWIIPWLLINKATPEKHPWITDKERAHILEIAEPNETVKVVKAYSWTQLLKFRDTWGIIGARFFIDPVWWLFITWLPTFLNDHFAFNIKEIGAFSWLPFTLAALGGILGGYHSSYQIKRGKVAHTARKRSITLGSVIMLLSLTGLALFLNTFKAYPYFAMILIGGTLFGFQFLISNLQTLPSDYFHGKNIGTVAGMGGTAAVLGTILTTLAVPYLTRTSYISFFVLAAILVPIAWCCIWFIHSKKKAVHHEF